MFKWLQRQPKDQPTSAIATDWLRQTQEEVDKLPKLSVLVAGKTGVGKSTLINALFREQLATTGVGQPVTQEVQRITKEGMPLVLYDTKGLELIPSSQRQVIQSIADLIQDQSTTAEPIDLCYYCIHGMSSRIEEMEMELIEAIAKSIPVILILTQDLSGESEFKTYLEGLDLPLTGIVSVLAKPYAVKGQQVIVTHGLQELVDLTMTIAPKRVHPAFVNAQQIDFQRKEAAARSWAKRYVKTAFGIGFTPIPLADASLLVPMQITMMAHLTAIFGLSLDYSQMMAILAGIGGTSGVTYVGKWLASSLLKFIPGIGTVTGNVLTGATAGGLTLALGYSYIEVLKYIGQAEAHGRTPKLKEIQKLMNDNYAQYMDFYQKYGADIRQWYRRMK